MADPLPIQSGLVLALIISVWTRRVILGLFVGLYAGVMMLTGPAPLESWRLMSGISSLN